jgi:FSR family fosmidomycin resistance protein-like MFS transporter
MLSDGGYAATVRAEIDKRAMAALSFGHLATDFAGGALPALLPFLVAKYGLSYTLAAVVMLVSTLSSSILQPVFGLWSDRRGAYWLIPAGVALGGVGMALAAASSSYGVVLLFVALSGLGTAAYHPEGSKFAAYASGRRRASGMALFSVGGNIGYGLGALATTPLVVWLGLKGGLFLMVPCVFAGALLLRLAPFLHGFEPERNAHRAEAGENRVGAMAILLSVILFRSLSWFGLLTFVPLWEVEQGHSKSYGNHLLALMLLAGGVGTLLAGPIADRYGRRTVIVVSSFVSPALVLVFLLVGGTAGAVALALNGVAIIGTYGPTMVLSQEYLPRHIAMASGLAIGFAIGLGGIAAVVLGAVADSVDLRTALWVSAVAPVPAFLLSLRLPATRRRARLTPETVTT